MKKKTNICKYLELNKNKKEFKLYIKKTKFSWHLDKDTILLKNFFSSINYRDYLASKGSLAVARRFPYVPGVDLVGKVIESSKRHARVVTSPIPLFHQLPSPWLGPHPMAKACGDNFHVPSS